MWLQVTEDELEQYPLLDQWIRSLGGRGGLFLPGHETDYDFDTGTCKIRPCGKWIKRGEEILFQVKPDA